MDVVAHRRSALGARAVFVEYGAVLRRWDLNRILTRAQTDLGIDALMGWPLRVTQVRGLFADAWRLRANVTFADAVYVALAAHLGADLLSDDGRLAKAPGLPVRNTAPARLTADPSRPSRQTRRIAAVRFRGRCMLMFRRAFNLYGGALGLGTMSRLDEALEVLPAPTRAAFWRTMTETPRSRPP
jgi:predicted nucleic acid-binding protein